MGVLPFVVSADPITNGDFSIDFIINDGNPADQHGENGWLVAGSGVSSTIRVNYIGSVPLNNTYVRFTSVKKDTYGDVSEGYVATAPYETVFSASKNRAGNAPILVEINFSVNGIGYDYSWTVDQKIDHNTPMRIQDIAFESEVTLNEMMDITMTMEDAYGNAVNSLYEDATGGMPEDVTFSTTSYAGSGFYNVSGYDAEVVNIPVNAEGLVVASFKTGTDAGPKYLIHIVPDMAINDKWLTITALANSAPYNITVSVDPNVDTPPYQPADGESKFYLTYNLFDQYGNPSGNQTVYFTDNVIGDSFTRRTNSYGQIMFTFGPFDAVSKFTIHAEAVENTSVAIDQVLRFTNTSPQEMLLTANPQSMPSADVALSFKAQILAKVTDESGNGVAGETVIFSINKFGNYSDAQVTEPSLPNMAEATTNVDGIATLNFTPGTFETDYDDPDYNETASDSCSVMATWVAGAKTCVIDLEWKNYPYLRVETEVNPATVEVGNPVEVTIRLIGDGWALYPDPIDVMLSVDRSGSMTYGSPDRMVSLMAALKIFNMEMTEGRDRVGMISFGKKGTISYANSPYIVPKTYSDYAEKDLSLNSLNRAVLNNTIDSLVPNSGTPMRGGLYEAIKEIVENPRADAVRAVIVLSDGDYNWYGDPLACGDIGFHWEWDRSIRDYVWVLSDPDDFGNLDRDYYKFDGIEGPINNDPLEQNMSVYANNNNITIYSIAFGNGLSPGGVSTLSTLATSTGGNYYYAPSGDKLAKIYTDIAGELKTEAGVDTTMDVMFTDIELNNVSQQNDPDDPILEYEYESGVSTLVKSWNTSGSEGSPNVIGPLTLDQTDDWNDNNSRSLNFDSSDIGTIHLGQTWQAVFRMDVLKAGNINIFGDGSAIFFNNGADSLTLPKTYITAVPDLAATGINFTGLQVYDLVCVEAENGDVIANYLTMNWNLNYSGINTATQYLYYQKVNDGIWTTFSEVPVTGPVSMLPHTRQLYVADFPPGEYKLRVRAMADDAPDSVIETPYTIVIGQGGQYFIRLE